MRVFIFKIMWRFENRNWKDCRHKRKAFDKAVANYKYSLRKRG